jgi:allantoinase
MKFDLIIRDGNVVTDASVTRSSVGIVDGVIAEIGEISRGGCPEIDATNLHVFPGLIDPHVHFNEPGRGEWEGLATGSSALAAGGGSCFFDMPLNSSPPTLEGESFDLKRGAAEHSSRTDFALWGGLTPRNLDRLEELADRGVVGFKAFMSNSGIDDFLAADDFTLYRGMQIAGARGLIVAVHAENDAITSALASAAMGRGRTGVDDYLKSRPVIAEVEAITRAITLAADAKCKLHIVHVSSEAGAKAAWAGRQIADVTYETCPHYFLLNDRDLHGLGAKAKCAPPLRPRSDGNYLKEALAAGTIHFVGSDHSPSPVSMKTGDNFFAIWGGIAGVQSTLPAMLSIDPPLRLEQIAGYTAGNIASRFGLKTKGQIAVGFAADFALVDVSERYVLEQRDLLDRHRQSPYVGMAFRGRVKRTIVRGNTVFQNGRSDSPFRGRLITPASGGGHAR